MKWKSLATGLAAVVVISSGSLVRPEEPIDVGDWALVWTIDDAGEVCRAWGVVEGILRLPAHPLHPDRTGLWLRLPGERFVMYSDVDILAVDHK
jgi:hypothetical protein